MQGTAAGSMVFPGDAGKMTDMLRYFDRYAQAYQPYKRGKWCYEDGCIYRGLDLLHQASGDPRWLAHLGRLALAQIDAGGGLAGYRAGDFNIDNILPGRILWSLGDARGPLAARLLAAQLDRHPRTAAGSYWHKARYPHQVWLDGLYMALPFQVEYGLSAGEPARIADALAQLSLALDLTATAGGLHVHGYDESRTQRWADPVTGQSPAVWARAMGWLAMALVDVLAVLPAESAIRARAGAILLAIADRQGASGLWPQVLDTPGLAGNYDETSASVMFAYAFLRGARCGLVSGDAMQRLRRSGLAALAGVQRDRLVPEGLRGICHVAGLGDAGTGYRDGSPAYYLTEPVVTDDPKGVGPLMMAVAEALRLPG